MATITYPLLSLTFDTVTTGAWTDIQAEQLLLLGTAAGLDDLGRIRVRANDIGGTVVATSSIVHIGRCSRGTRDGELDVADNMFISVIDLRQIWATPPRIDVTTDPDNPVTYKDGNIAFSIGDEFKPIVNFGSDRIAVVAGAGDSADFAFDATLSKVTDPAATATKTYLYTIGSGSVQAGSVSTATVTVRYPVGARYVKCRVTDSNGNYEDSWRLVVVTYPGDPHLLRRVTLRRSQRADGQTVSLDVDDDLPYSTYPDGTEVLAVQHEDYGGTSGSLVGEGLIYQGWIQSESASVEARKTGLRKATQLQLADAAGRLKSLPGFPFVVNRVNGDGAAWEDMRALDLDLYGYHLIKWHSNALRRVDYLWSGIGATYPVSTLGSDGQTLWEQHQFIARAMRCALTCDQTNRLRVVGDPILQPNAAQVAEFALPVQRTTVVIATIGEGDWKNYRTTYARSPRAHWNWGSAIVASTDEPDDQHEIGTVFCVAPGVAPGQGDAEQTSGQQVVNALTSQQELNVVEGNRYAARMNNRYGNVTFDVRAGDIGIDPALMEWVGLTVTAETAAQRGRTLSGNFLPLEITYDYDGRRGTCKKTIAFEQEVEGTPAEIDDRPTDTVGTYPPILPPSLPPPVPQPVPPYNGELPVEGFVLSAADTQAARAVSFNPSTGVITYVDRSSGLSGTGIWFSSNPYAYKQAFALTSYGMEYLSDQSNNAAVWTQRLTNLQLWGDAGKVGWIIRMSHLRNGWGMALSFSGERAITTDAWQTCTMYNDVFLFDFNICGHDVNHLYATGVDGNLYYSTDGGVTLTSTSDYVGPWPVGLARRLHIPYMRADGTPNRDDGTITGYQTFNYNSGGDQAGRIAVYPNGFGSSDGFTWPGAGPVEDPTCSGLNAQQPATAFTYDPTYSWYACANNGGSGRGLHVRHTDDFFATRPEVYDNGTVTPYVNSINGWSSNPNAAIIFGKGDGVSSGGILQITFDGGGTWFGNTPSFFTGGVDAPIATAEFSLWRVQG